MTSSSSSTSAVSLLLLLLVSSLFVLSCSSSENPPGGEPATTGQFIDAPVQGLDYSCSSGSSGVTDGNGEYVCNAGDDVTFSLGSVVLGTVAVQEDPLTPYSLFPSDTTAAVNLARLLQALDADGEPNNAVIVIDAALVASLPGDIDFSSPAFETEIESALPGTELPSPEDAQARLNEAILQAGGSIPNGGHIPVANAGSDRSVAIASVVMLDGSGSSDADGDGLTYEWSFVLRPDGSNAGLSDAAVVDPSFTADAEGDYVIQLRVHDGTVFSGADTVTIAASSNQAPIADAGPTQHVATDSLVTLDGSGSHDDDGDDLSYRWAIDSAPFGSTAALSGATTVAPTFTPDLNGTFIIELIVNDGQVDSERSTVAVVSHPAVAEGAPDLEWIVETGTNSFDRVNDIAVDSAANVYITGYTRGGLDGNPSTGYNDVFIAKYDSDGERTWTIQILGTGGPGNSGDTASGIAVDDARGVLYVVGWTTGDFNGEPNSGALDLFITKYSTDGTNQWTVVNGTASSDLGYDVAVDAAGDIYVTGMTEGALEGNTQKGGRDIFISKYDADGVHQWTAQPGTNNYEYGYGIATDPDSNAYVVGYTGGGLDGNSNLGRTDIIVTKYDTNGVRQWTQQLGTSLADVGRAIAVDASGNVYVTGNTDGAFGDTANGETDVAIAKLDSDGVVQWTEQLGTAGEDWGYGIALDSEGGVHVSGHTNDALSGNVSQGTSDYFIAKYSNGGAYQWALQDGRELEDWSSGLAIDAFNNIYATGVTHALLPNRGSSEDIFIVRYGDYAVTGGGGPYTVGGTVTGIVGTFTLTNNGGDEITIEANGSFTFPTGLPDGAAYSVEVSGYQDGGHMCIVSGGDNDDGTGVIPGADVTSIVVTCFGV